MDLNLIWYCDKNFPSSKLIGQITRMKKDKMIKKHKNYNEDQKIHLIVLVIHIATLLSLL
jgi:hypothetical protein